MLKNNNDQLTLAELDKFIKDIAKNGSPFFTGEGLTEEQLQKIYTASQAILEVWDLNGKKAIL